MKIEKDMRILKRYKNDSGQTIGYRIEQRTKTASMENDYTVEEAIVFRNRIKNATLLSNSEYIAKKGCKIETQRVNTTKTTKIAKPVKVASPTMPKDYFGKDFIKVCRKIRKYANANRLKLDTKPHQANEGRNIHLFKLIETCGVSLHDFVRGYLCNLQPYSLTAFNNGTETSKYDIWLCDVGYGVQFIIKIDTINQYNPVVVSFHESNVGGIAIYGGNNFANKKCAVFVEDLDEKPMGCYAIFTVQRGFLVATINSKVDYYNNDFALVDEIVINRECTYMLDNIINLINTKYLSASSSALAWNTVRLNKMSFMSLGFEKTNNICLLFDLYEQHQNDASFKKALVTLAFEIFSKSTDSYRKELLTALGIKYKGLDNELYKAIEEKYDA